MISLLKIHNFIYYYSNIFYCNKYLSDYVRITQHLQILGILLMKPWKIKEYGKNTTDTKCHGIE